MRFGQQAIDRLVQRYPGAHKFFGEHKSIHNFAVILSSPNWLVIEKDNCWIFAERANTQMWEVHWFFPRGINMVILREFVAKVFDMTTAKALFGEVHESLKMARRARMVNRALGAEKVDGMYLLTRSRFMAYSQQDSKRKD